MSKPITFTAVFAVLAAIAAPTAEAQMPKWAQAQLSPRADTQQRQTPRSFRRLEVPGDEVESNVRTLLRKLRWHSSLSGALQSARAKGKPVVWIQALGDLNGFL